MNKLAPGLGGVHYQWGGPFRAKIDLTLENFHTPSYKAYVDVTDLRLYAGPLGDRGRRGCTLLLSPHLCSSSQLSEFHSGFEG